jgi:hypothetical protein
MAQCGCDVVSSEDEIFKIKFCLIAPEPVEVKRGKRVQSIEEIFMEIK